MYSYFDVVEGNVVERGSIVEPRVSSNANQTNASAMRL